MPSAWSPWSSSCSCGWPPSARHRRAAAAGRRLVRLPHGHGRHRLDPALRPRRAAWLGVLACAGPPPPGAPGRRRRRGAGLGLAVVGGGGWPTVGLRAAAWPWAPRWPPAWRRLAQRRLGGFTGDVLGAAGVVGETVALLVLAVGDERPDVGPRLRLGGGAGCADRRPLGRAAASTPHPVAVFGSAMAARRAPALRRLPAGRDRAHRHRRRPAAPPSGLAADALAGPELRHRAVATALAVAGRGLADAAERWPSPDRGGRPRSGPPGRPGAGRSGSLGARRRRDRPRRRRVGGREHRRRRGGAGLLGRLAGGAGALGYRAVNTLDAMVGHRSPRYERLRVGQRPARRRWPTGCRPG